MASYIIDLWFLRHMKEHWYRIKLIENRRGSPRCFWLWLLNAPQHLVNHYKCYINCVLKFITAKPVWKFVFTHIRLRCYYVIVRCWCCSQPMLTLFWKQNVLFIFVYLLSLSFLEQRGSNYSCFILRRQSS